MGTSSAKFRHGYFSGNITVVDPTSAQHVATKNYVDSNAGGATVSAKNASSTTSQTIYGSTWVTVCNLTLSNLSGGKYMATATLNYDPYWSSGGLVVAIYQGSSLKVSTGVNNTTSNGDSGSVTITYTGSLDGQVIYLKAKGTGSNRMQITPNPTSDYTSILSVLEVS